jgi:hypothetical protein
MLKCFMKNIRFLLAYLDIITVSKIIRIICFTYDQPIHTNALAHMLFRKRWKQ